MDRFFLNSFVTEEDGISKMTKDKDYCAICRAKLRPFKYRWTLKNSIYYQVLCLNHAIYVEFLDFFYHNKAHGHSTDRCCIFDLVNGFWYVPTVFGSPGQLKMMQIQDTV